MPEEKAGYIFVDASIPFPMLAELPDLEADQYLVLRCARAMTAKLTSSRAQGRGGWHTPGCSDIHLHKMLQEHLEKGDMVDVLNIAGMILVRQESVQEMYIRDGQEPLSITESTLVLGPTGGVGTKTEKIKNMLETYNWTSQNAPSEGDAEVPRSASYVNGVRED